MQLLSVDMASGTEDMLSLAQNPSLTQCNLFVPPSSANFSFNAGSFEGCTSMERLGLQYQRALSLQPDCFSALSALVSLTLADCGLSAVPSAVTPLVKLNRLDISLDEDLVIDESGAGVLRTLKKLRMLDVVKSKPAVHTVPSLQALFNLVDTFRDEGFPLHVNLDPTCSDPFEPDVLFCGFGTHSQQGSQWFSSTS